MLEHGALTQRVIGLAIEVHRQIGPGLLESVYEASLCLELTQAGIAHERQVVVPVTYKGHVISLGFRADIIVANKIILELKTVVALQPEHDAQLPVARQ